MKTQSYKIDNAEKAKFVFLLRLKTLKKSIERKNMNNFSVYIKENGTYEKVNAVAMFPFNFGQLLDEQGDEKGVLLYSRR